MESLPACSRTLPSRPVFRSRPPCRPCSRPGSPFPWRRLLLNLLRAERRARAPDPQAAVAKAQVRMEARLGTGGSLPAETAAWLQNGGLGRGGGPDRRPGDPGGGEVHGAEHPRASAAARESFTHDAGDLEDRGASRKTGVPARPRSQCGGRCALAPPGLDRPWARAPQGARPPGPPPAQGGRGHGRGPGRRPLAPAPARSGCRRHRSRLWVAAAERPPDGRVGRPAEAVPEAPTSGAFGPSGRGSPRAP